MLRICRNKKPIRSSWQALVRTTVTRLVWNHRRDEATRKGHVRFDSEAALLARDVWPGALDNLIEEETETELLALLGQLDERFGAGTRAILELRSQAVPWKEVIAIVDLPLRTCSDREARAKQWLTDRLSLHESRGRAS
jgi:hypothetical protein